VVVAAGKSSMTAGVLGRRQAVQFVNMQTLATPSIAAGQPQQPTYSGSSDDLDN